MLHQFNSLVKGSEEQISHGELAELLRAPLRPARSVDTSFFDSCQHLSGGPVLPLERTLTAESLVRVRCSSDSGQATRSNGPSQVEGGPGHEFDRVSEERWTEQNEPREQPSELRYGSAFKHLDQWVMENQNGEGASARYPVPVVPWTRPLSELRRVFRARSDAISMGRQLEVPGVYRTASDAVAQSRQFWLPPEVEKTSSVDVMVLGRRSSLPDYNHTVVDILTAQPGSGVGLEDVSRNVLAAGPTRTISSCSTDSAAEHCR